MNKAARIQDCIDNHETYVLTLAAMPDKKLAEKLEAIHLQMAIAEQKNDTNTLELLEVWRAQTIEARTCKAENNIPDAVNEIEQVTEQIESFVAEAETRTGALQDYSNTLNQRHSRPKKHEGNNEQLSFF
jgi:DNA repair ATPase RecN